MLKMLMMMMMMMMKFCIWTPPAAETFQCFITRIVRRLN